jgi:hypothetical protein
MTTRNKILKLVIFLSLTVIILSRLSFCVSLCLSILFLSRISFVFSCPVPIHRIQMINVNRISGKFKKDLIMDSLCFEDDLIDPVIKFCDISVDQVIVQVTSYLSCCLVEHNWLSKSSRNNSN